MRLRDLVPRLSNQQCRIQPHARQSPPELFSARAGAFCFSAWGNVCTLLCEHLSNSPAGRRPAELRRRRLRARPISITSRHPESSPLPRPRVIGGSEDSDRKGQTVERPQSVPLLPVCPPHVRCTQIPEHGRLTVLRACCCILSWVHSPPKKMLHPQLSLSQPDPGSRMEVMHITACDPPRVVADWRIDRYSASPACQPAHIPPPPLCPFPTCAQYPDIQLACLG